jgi:hypothetical protein
MQNKIILKIDVTKIIKGDLYEGKKGVYLDATLFHNTGESKYGDDGFIVQSIPQERREKGEKGPIIGNWRWLEAKTDKRNTEPEDADNSDVPF